MITALIILVYLVGCPVAAGLIHTPLDRKEWGMKWLMAGLSWLGVGLFSAMTLAIVAATALHALGRRWGAALDRFAAIALQ